MHNFIKYKNSGWWIKITNVIELLAYIDDYSYDFTADRYMNYLDEYGTLFFNRCGGWNYGLNDVIVQTVTKEDF